MHKKLYLKNAALLTVGGFALRALGMLFRVYLAAMLGAEGMGLYQLILAVYMVFVSLACSGMPVASARFAAQQLARGKGLRRTVADLCAAAAVLGTAAMLLQYLLAPIAANAVLHDARAELSLRLLAPSLPFMAVAGGLRGCFLASRKVTPNVTAQLIEQTVRMGIVAWLLPQVVHWGAGYACAAVLAGNLISEAISCLIMAAFAKREPSFAGGEEKAFSPRELSRVLLPVEGGRILASGLQALESAMIPLCLAAFLGQRTQAMAQYGALKGMAVPLLFFPFTILAALAGLLMPEITRTHVQGDLQKTRQLIDKMMRLAGGFSVLASVLFMLYGRQVAALLYSDERAGAYLQILAAAAPFMYLESMVDAVLKGLGEQWATFRYSLVDSALRIASVALVVPRWGIYGFLAVMVVSNLFTCALNTRRMLKTVALKANWLYWLFLPVLFAALCGAAGALLVHNLPFGVAVSGWLGASITVLGYLPLLWWCGGIKNALTDAP